MRENKRGHEVGRHRKRGRTKRNRTEPTERPKGKREGEEETAEPYKKKKNRLMNGK